MTRSYGTAEPRYIAIERALRARLATLPVGAPLATEAALCEEFGVSRMTVRAALAQLRADGLVRRVPGRGTFVSAPVRAGATDGTDAGGIEEAVALLEALAGAGEAGVAGLADALGRTRADTAALLDRLTALGLVEPGAGAGTVRLGLRLFRLGSSVQSRLDVVAAARPVLEELNRATEETVYLCVRRGFEAVCVDRVDGLWVRSLLLRLGGTMPLHLGAATRVLLAHAPGEVRDAYLAQAPFVPPTPAAPVTRAAIEAELARILERGHAVSDGDIRPGIAAVGAPVRDHEGAVCAAVSVGGLRPAILDDEAATAALVTEGAARISAALGHERG